MIVDILGFAGGKVKDPVDACVIVSSNQYGYIRDVDNVLTRLITEYF
jgi:hypothetical protein